jgi:hypothetical protein
MTKGMIINISSIHCLLFLLYSKPKGLYFSMSKFKYYQLERDSEFNISSQNER